MKFGVLGIWVLDLYVRIMDVCCQWALAQVALLSLVKERWRVWSGDKWLNPPFPQPISFLKQVIFFNSKISLLVIHEEEEEEEAGFVGWGLGWTWSRFILHGFFEFSWLSWSLESLVSRIQDIVVGKLRCWSWVVLLWLLLWKVILRFFGFKDTECFVLCLN